MRSTAMCWSSFEETILPKTSFTTSVSASSSSVVAYRGTLNPSTDNEDGDDSRSRGVLDPWTDNEDGDDGKGVEGGIALGLVASSV